MSNPIADLHVRDSVAEDVPAIQRLYAHEVLSEVASFETQPPSVAEMQRRRDAVLAGGYPYLVAESAGALCGYCYASAYRSRPAYAHTIENSVYVAPEAQRRGVGRVLLSTLIERCRAQGYRQLIAVISTSERGEGQGSLALHRAHGFRTVGVLREVGYKFDRWIDTTVLQLALVEAEHG